MAAAASGEGAESMVFKPGGQVVEDAGAPDWLVSEDPPERPEKELTEEERRRKSFDDRGMAPRFEDGWDEPRPDRGQRGEWSSAPRWGDSDSDSPPGEARGNGGGAPRAWRQQDERRGGAPRAWQQQDERRGGPPREWQPRDERPGGAPRAWKQQDERRGGPQRESQPRDERPGGASRAWKQQDERRGGAPREWQQRDARPRGAPGAWQQHRDEPPRERRKSREEVNKGQLTLNLGKAKTEEHVRKNLEEAMAVMSLNEIHVTAAYFKLGSIYHTLSPEFANSDVLGELAAHTRRLAERRDLGPREASSILRSVAVLQDQVPSCKMLIRPLLRLVTQLAESMTPQSLANTFWSVGELMPDGEEKAEAVVAAEAAALEKVKEFKWRDVADILWGLGAWGPSAGQSPLVQELMIAVYKKSTSMNVEDATNNLPIIACALVRLGIWDSRVMDAIAFRVSPVIKELRRWSISALVWAWRQPNAVIPPKAPAGTRPGSWPHRVGKFASVLERQVRIRKLTDFDIDSSPLGPRARPQRPALPQESEAAGPGAGAPAGGLGAPVGEAAAPPAKAAAPAEQTAPEGVLVAP